MWLLVTAHSTKYASSRNPSSPEFVSSSLCQWYSWVENGSLYISRLWFCKWEATRRRGRCRKEI